jgi:penicillin-binding protein 1A
MELGQGASTALPICAKFMQKVYADSVQLGFSPSSTFARPEKMNIELNCKKYKGQKVDKSQDFGGDD